MNDLATAAAGFPTGNSPLTGTTLNSTKKKVFGNKGAMAKGVAAGANPTQGSGVGRPNRMETMQIDRPKPAFGKSASARAYAAGYMFKLSAYDEASVAQINPEATAGQSPQALKALADQYNKDLMGRTFGSNTGQAVTGIGLGAGAGAALGGAFGGGRGAMMGGGIGAMLSALVPIIFPDYQKAFVWLQNAMRRGTVERDLKAINTKIDEAKHVVPEGESEKDKVEAEKAQKEKQKAAEDAKKAAEDAEVQAATDEVRNRSTPAAGNVQAATQTQGLTTPTPAPANPLTQKPTGVV